MKQINNKYYTVGTFLNPI